MRFLFTVILGMMLLNGRSWAQEDYVGTATSALQDVLTTLKTSVEKLTLDNDQLAARDNAMKQQIAQLQSQLEGLEAQGEFLKKTAAQLQDKNPRRTQQIERLEKENSDLDNHIQKTQSDAQLIQQALDAANQQEHKAPAPGSQDEERRQKEKLKLMKMIDASQQRQETLHEAITEFQKNKPLLPAASTMAHQPLDDSQLRQLEVELKDLEQNYLQLKNLMEQMSKKAKAAQMTVSQHIEEEKLQSSMNDLNRQGVGLRNDLDDLRSQMVDLDKRKSHLETMVKGLPVN